MKKESLSKIIEISFVLVVASAMYIYGIGKYIQFDSQQEITKSVSELTGMELMWAFYGYSRTYAVILGIAEILGGTLLLIRRTRILGAILLTGILMNVITQDIIYGVNLGALKAAIIYQLMIFAILWIHRIDLITGIKSMLINRIAVQGTKDNRLVIIIGSILLALVLKLIGFQITH